MCSVRRPKIFYVGTGTLGYGSDEEDIQPCIVAWIDNYLH